MKIGTEFTFSDSKYSVGRMEINSIENLNKISVAASTVSILSKVSLADIDYVSDSEGSDDEQGIEFKKRYVVLVVIQFFYGVVPLAEMAGFTPFLLQLLALRLSTCLDSGHPEKKLLFVIPEYSVIRG